MSDNQIYVALLRGINVGGHHKVPMAELREEMENMEFKNVQTLLNSGNIIFDGDSDDDKALEEKISTKLETIFGFTIPVLIRKKEDFLQLFNANPFENVEVTKDIRLYASFLKDDPESTPPLPWISEDEAFLIIDVRGRTVCSVLDLSVSKTTKAMGVLGKMFGDNMTTRNWKTVNRIAKKLS